MRKKPLALTLGDMPERVRRAGIRTTLAEILDAPLEVGCRTCAIFFPDGTVGPCPLCERPLMKLGQGETRQSLIIDSLVASAIRNPEGPASRVLLGYRYGVPGPVQAEVEEDKRPSMSNVVITVVERDGTETTETMPQLLEPKKKTA